jgi:hypothetical protein
MSLEPRQHIAALLPFDLGVKRSYESVDIARVERVICSVDPAHLLLLVPARRRPAGLPLQDDRQLALRPEAGPNPWRAKTIEWQVSSPPPVFNFQAIPRVVGGPYEFGVPGARHVLMPGEEAEQVGARQATEVQAA